MPKRKNSNLSTPKPKRVSRPATQPSPTLNNYELASLNNYLNNQSPGEIAEHCTDYVNDEKSALNVSKNMLKIFKYNPSENTYNALMGSYHLGKNETFNAVKYWCFPIYDSLISRASQLRLRSLTSFLINQKALKETQTASNLSADICEIIIDYHNEAKTIAETKHSEPTALLFS
jgi:hypothetical protein